MTRSESSKFLDECTAWLDSLSDEDIKELAQPENEYVLKAEMTVNMTIRLLKL